ncbi:MAG TPA: FecR domain-containing protein [Terriglobia bacterium]
MKREKDHTEVTLGEIAAEIRAEQVDEQLTRQAAHRVWARVFESSARAALAPDIGQTHAPNAPMKTQIRAQIRGCSDFQALIPAHLTKTLPEERLLLLQDHVSECVACRHALNAARSGARPAPATPFVTRIDSAARRRWSWTYAWAAAAVLLLGIGIGLVGTERLFQGHGTQAVVQAVDGVLYQVSDRDNLALASGRAVSASQEIRTANASSAVIRLVDGSSVEMGERADLWLSRGWRGTKVHLERGNIIVQAAKQGNGRLDVATRDCLISVKGTIFAVDEGMKGARISVIQGVVQVTQDGRARLLHPGEQISTRAALAQVPVTQQVAWSRNAGEYLALLSEFGALNTQLEALPGPAARYDSALLKKVPGDTVFYVAIPNIGSTLSQANELFQQRLQQSEVLQRWWSQRQASGQAQKTQQMIDRIRAFSDYLGDEVVLAMPAGGQSPLLLAEVRRPDFAAFLQGQLSQMKGEGGPDAELVTNPALAGAGSKGRILFFLKNNILTVAADASELQEEAALIDGSASSGFTSTPFYAAIQQAYQSGAGWLICANMEQILSTSVVSVREENGKRYELFKDPNVGFVDMRYLIMESKDVSGQTQNRATLTFAQERRGIASWLAAPSPMGTLDFVSPDASFAVSFVAKEPRDIVQDIFAVGANSDPQFTQDLADFESKTGVNVQDDLATALGGEMTLALDGPVLPTPSWKVAVEVNDPARLEAAVEKLVPAFNQEGGGKAGQLSLTRQTTDGRTFYDLHFSPAANSAGTPSVTDINYVFVDGYLLAASNRALLLSSIQNRETGYSLARSSDFTSRLPRDGYANFSGLVYQNLWAAVAPIADQLRSSAALTPAERQAIEELSQNNAPSLVCAYGEPDQIVVANTGNLLGMGLESLLGMGGARPFDVLQIIENAARQAPKG